MHDVSQGVFVCCLFCELLDWFLGLGAGCLDNCQDLRKGHLFHTIMDNTPVRVEVMVDANDIGFGSFVLLGQIGIFWMLYRVVVVVMNPNSLIVPLLVQSILASDYGLKVHVLELSDFGVACVDVLGDSSEGEFAAWVVWQALLLVGDSFPFGEQAIYAQGVKANPFVFHDERVELAV